MNRRRLLSVVGMAVLAGCASDDGDERGESDDVPNPALEYDQHTPQPHTKIPDELVQHPNPGEFAWIQVDITVTQEEITVQDLLNHTHVQREGTREFARGVVVSGDILHHDDSSERQLGEGDNATVYYRVDTGTERWEWRAEQIEAKYNGLEIHEL